MKKWGSQFFLILLVLLLALGCYLFWRLGDRHPAYMVDFNYTTPSDQIYTGAASLPVELPYFESWTDVNSNAKYEPGIDDYIDENNNGEFEPLFLAGFQSPRPIVNINDPVTARALIIRVGKLKMALLVFDLIGLSNDDVVDIQKKVKAELQVQQLQVICTHNHQGPDVIGLWGDSPYSSGVHPEFLANVKSAGLAALQLADASLQLSTVSFTKTNAAQGMIADTRPPIVKDPDIYLMQCQNFQNEAVIATLFSWGNHVETAWKQNTSLTSDFVHYWRQALENGIRNENEEIIPASGGVAIFVPGAIGGLMTTNPETGIPTSTGDSLFYIPNIEKAKRQGEQLALLTHQALRDSQLLSITRSSLKLMARTIELPLANREFQMAAALGIVDRGMTKLGMVRSEISLWQLGPATFLHLPGEVYPEIINGGIEMPEGHDLGNDLIEIPAIRPQMPGNFPWVIGMTNDMVGYIIPHSQWDAEAPYTYGAERAHYGERLSLGPETAPILHRSLLTLIAEAHDNTSQ